MGKIFNPESGLMRALGTVGDLMILNLLFLVCSLPVVTAGASLAAMYSVALKIAGGRGAGVVKPFFTAFKGSFLKATALWILYLFAGVLIFLGMRVIRTEEFPLFFDGVYLAVSLLVLFNMTWAFPLEAQFENRVADTVKNAFILSFSKLPVTLAALLLNLIPVGLCLFATYWFLATGFLWVLFGFAGIAVINSLMFLKVFHQLKVQTE